VLGGPFRQLLSLLLSLYRALHRVSAGFSTGFSTGIQPRFNRSSTGVTGVRRAGQGYTVRSRGGCVRRRVRRHVVPVCAAPQVYSRLTYGLITGLIIGLITGLITGLNTQAVAAALS
jgi:hypothetical protein